MASPFTAAEETTSSNSEQAQMAEQKHADIRSLRMKAVTVTTSPASTKRGTAGARFASIFLLRPPARRLSQIDAEHQPPSRSN
jgi:hypothetical protein